MGQHFEFQTNPKTDYPKGQYLADFLTDRQWTPLFDDAHFGIMVLLSGTLTSSAVALAIATVPGELYPELWLVKPGAAKDSASL